jgi:hypothetical protein
MLNPASHSLFNGSQAVDNVEAAFIAIHEPQRGA